MVSTDLVPPATEDAGPDAADTADPGPRIRKTLQDNLMNRTLSTQTHGAWQILHGVLAYGKQFDVDTPAGKKPALDLALSGGQIAGFNPVAGDLISSDLIGSDLIAGEQRRGLVMDLQASTKIGQGHRDQWLAIVAQSGVPLDAEIRAEQKQMTVEDWLRQVEYDVPRNLEIEFSWTLIPLTIYRSTDYQWTARDGQTYSIEELLESECRQELSGSVCGGTHRLIGISMALQARREEGKPITGVWELAESRIAGAIELAKQNQNSDGSFSASYIHRPGWTRDLGETLGTTGHVLEFLAFAADDQTLAEPWVRRSVQRLCDVLDQCRDVELECGVLYHALHGLAEYEQRISR